jgi:SAM-dependent methyltransferase
MSSHAALASVPLAPTAHGGPVLVADAAGHEVIDCAACGFAHFWPKPSEAELAAYYARGFYETHGPPDWAEKEAAEEGYWRIEHAERLATVAELLGRETASLLDVGCGGGWLIAHARAAGWDVLGVEPSAAMWERARQRAPVVRGTFPDADLGGRTFDAVHLKLVLEHVHEPAEFLAAVRAVLRPGGVVCVEVPNDFTPLQAAARAALDKPPWWVVWPVHMNYFGGASLERLLGRTGFTPLRRTATYPMEWFLLQGVDYIGRDDVGRRCHAERMALESTLEAAGLGALRQSFGRWLAAEGIGREAVVYARRP